MPVETPHELANSLQVPFSALRTKTRNIISQLLNSTKVIPSPGGLPRDWRGLAHFAGILSPPVDSPDPTGVILSIWEKQSPSPNLAQLQSCFGQLDRWDVLDDTCTLFEDDAKEYKKRKQTWEIVKRDPEDHILTHDDNLKISTDSELQTYHAFLLFADEDVEFAKKIVDKLENHYSLKLCLKDRDLIGGQFEHDAIMKLIAERCKRMIIIISPAFLESPFNKFFVSFAQALGIEQRQRKIIPCVYQSFMLPPELRPYFVLDYNRAGQFWDFWEKLSQSIMPSAPIAHRRCNIKEIEPSTKQDKLNGKLPEPTSTKAQLSTFKYDETKFIAKKEPEPKSSSKLKLDTGFKALSSGLFRKPSPTHGEIKKIEKKEKSKGKSRFWKRDKPQPVLDS